MLRPLALVVLSVGLSAADARAGLITWSGPQTIADDADVSTNGTLVRAYQFENSGATYTVNGVAFDSYIIYGVDTSTFDDFTDPGVFGSAAAPYASLSADYRGLLGGGRFSFGSNPVTYTLTGLTVGTAYEVQVWVNDSRAGINRSQTVSGSGSLEYNTAQADGGVGQFVIGTFTADAATQVLTFTPDGTSYGAQLNALQLRDLGSPAAVPEPASLALLAVGVGPLAAVVRRFRRRAEATT